MGGLLTAAVGARVLARRSSAKGWWRRRWVLPAVVYGYGRRGAGGFEGAGGASAPFGSPQRRRGSSPWAALEFRASVRLLLLGANAGEGGFAEANAGFV
ncbi:proteoglycan 4-like [Iris pallida]|uniref:Proteoglycan 4-like n=1 Tax=Iris pallida TaxID=29817 RepID=A0AAX6FZ55_IRIPA|nr:proteoglycan 4-like [Iris pallida]KAJ6848973.1 proteoglycan 4-like [Iris pallida]